MDGASPHARRDAADLQRGRRHELRVARAGSAAARLRPPAAAGARPRGASRSGRREDDDARRRRAHAHRRPTCWSATPTAARRRSPGSWEAPPPRCRTTPPRSSWRPRTSSRWASPARRSGWGCAPSRAPASSGASTRTACSPDRRAPPSSCNRSRTRRWHRSRSTSTRSRSPRPGSRCERRGSKRCSALPSRADRVKDALRPLEIEVEGDGDDFVAIAPTFRPDLVARDRHRRRGGAPDRLQRDPAHPPAHHGCAEAVG